MARYEKNNRYLFLTGCFFVGLVVSFWIVVVLNAQVFSNWLLQPGAQEKQMLGRLNASVSSPSPREKMLLEYCGVVLNMNLTVVKLLTLKSIATLLFINGVLAMCFSFHERRLLKLAREELESQ